MSKYNVMKDGVVINIIEWDGTSVYDPGEGCTLELVNEEVEE